MAPPASALFAAFADQIRTKPDWSTKVLDEERALLPKWLGEWSPEGVDVDSGEVAALVAFVPPPYLCERALMSGSYRDLLAEARRVKLYDSLSFLESGGEAVLQPSRSHDWTQIDQTLFESSKETLIETPYLKDRLGVRVADGAVPASLHRIVRRLSCPPRVHRSIDS